MKYRIDAAVKPAGDGYGFDITNGHSAQIVSFEYIDVPQAEKARALVEKAVALATSITGYDPRR
jgi:hypothetical protein